VDNEWYMNRCFELAAKGKGSVSPNPLVGSLIVHEGKIIGEGYHQKYGEAHAEVNAINSVKDKSLLENSTLYVNLEPCSHQGQTPPCSLLVIQYKIPRVVICNHDPNPKVNGRGIQMLRDAGVNITTNILEEEGLFINRYFFQPFVQHRPYIILKWAETSDGFLGRTQHSNSNSAQISGEMSRKWLHQLRAETDAILVGVNTVLEDDPQLNTRLYPGKNPLRFVIDPNNRITDTSKLIKDTEPSIILSNVNEKTPYYEKIDCSETGVHQTLIKVLTERNLNSIMVEGGASTLKGFIESGLWDEAYVLKSQIEWKNGIEAPAMQLAPQNEKMLDDTKLIYYRNRT